MPDAIAELPDNTIIRLIYSTLYPNIGMNILFAKIIIFFAINKRFSILFQPFNKIYYLCTSIEPISWKQNNNNKR